jgi:glycerate-2-kinase
VPQVDRAAVLIKQPAAGKAAASMALATENHWPKGSALEGIAVTLLDGLGGSCTVAI